MESEEFGAGVRAWGLEYLRIGQDSQTMTYWNNVLAAELSRCPEGTTHAGALIPFQTTSNVANIPQCNIGPVADVEPWWAPGTTVRVAGGMATDVRTDEETGDDCGREVTYTGGGQLFFGGRRPQSCGCGPNLVYCTPFTTRGTPVVSGLMASWSAEYFPRRALFEEPGRLFQHIVMEDRDFSDLVLGDYTMVNSTLHHLYVRSARRGLDRGLDDDTWWRQYASRDEWREQRFESMDPDILSQPDYHFDPRSEAGFLRGLSAAGILTTVSATRFHLRERVRAARWLEALACRDFSPPPADVEFPAYHRDPGTEGSCVHCHQLIDPVAIHFKRFMGTPTTYRGIPGGIQLIGMEYSPEGSHGWTERARASFVHDTLLTPVSEAQLVEDPNRRYIDFLEPGQTLFGRESDGTNGPRGFANLLVESGEFDRCVVRRAYERFGAAMLAPGIDEELIRELSARFVDEGRNMRALVAHIVRRDEMKRGL